MKSKYLEVGLEAVKNAEEVILKYYSKNIERTFKSDLSPVTIADTEAERVIIKTIKSVFPDHGFLGEEHGVTTTSSEYQWVIDPIDGTKNYVREIPFFATQLALMKNDELILGISNAPKINECIYAEKGQGAFLNEEKMYVSMIDDLAAAYVNFGGLKYFGRAGKIENLLNLVEKTKQSRSVGDFWSHHLVAQGKTEGQVETDLKFWDFAALQVIIQEAGGKVTDLTGNPTTKNTTAIISSNGLLHDTILRNFL